MTKAEFENAMIEAFKIGQRFGCSYGKVQAVVVPYDFKGIVNVK